MNICWKLYGIVKPSAAKCFFYHSRRSSASVFVLLPPTFSSARGDDSERPALTSFWRGRQVTVAPGIERGELGSEEEPDYATTE